MTFEGHLRAQHSRHMDGRPHPAGNTPKLVGVVWTLLLVNTMAFTTIVDMLIPFPQWFAQLVTMTALVAALGLAIVLNPRVQIRPDAFLLLLTLLLLVSMASTLSLESGLGGLFRVFRFTVFVTVLWLLTRWWTSDLTFVRYTLKYLLVMLLLVLAGLAISPSSAMGGEAGRLVGTLWPMTAPRVGQLGAVVTGLIVILSLTRLIDRRTAAGAIVIGVTCLLLSHTRTAVVALIVALTVALFTLLGTSKRVRRAMTTTTIVVAVGCPLLWSPLSEWFRRDQSAEQLGSLTGRQTVWKDLLEEERGGYQLLLGTGLGDKSFNGAPVDNSWLAVYLEQGYIGVATVGVILLYLGAAVLLRKPSPARACATFLVVFCVMCTYTEVGLGDASPYLLYLALAAALLKPAAFTDESVRPQERGLNA